MVQITEVELDELQQKAQAWDDHIRRRLLEGGEVPCQLTIECVKGSAVILVRDRVIVTPFGKLPVREHPSGARDYAIHPGDMLNFDSLVQFRLS